MNNHLTPAVKQKTVKRRGILIISNFNNLINLQSQQIYNFLCMGPCQSDETKGAQFNSAQLPKATTTTTKAVNQSANTASSSAGLRQTHLKLSDLSSISRSQKEELNNTGYPINPENGVNRLILGVGRGVSSNQYIKYYLIYNFYINQLDPSNKTLTAEEQKTELESAKAGFKQLFLTTHPTDQKDIEALAQKYESATKLNKKLVLMNAYFQNNFLREDLNRIPIEYEDPKIIGHLRLPIYELYNGISAVYKEKKYTNKELYIVVTLNKTEKDILTKLMKNDDSFCFSVFMRGFTKKAAAMKKKIELGSESILFNVNFFPKNKTEKSVDYGYYILETQDENILKDGDVIFNILNFFQVSKDSLPGQREYDVMYNSLAYSWYARNEERTLSSEPQILRVFAVAKGATKYNLKSQSSLFRVIGQRDDSIGVSQNILKQSNTGNISELQKTNLIDNQIDDNNLKEALETVPDSQTSPILKAKRLQVLYEMKSFDECDKLLEKLEPQSQNYKKKDFSAYQIIEYISARRKMMGGKYNGAKDQLTKLRDAMKEKYGFDFEFMARDVLQSMDQCSKKMNASTAEPLAGASWDHLTSAINLRPISKFQ